MKFKDTKYGDLTGQEYEGDIDVSRMGLTSLEGAPEDVYGEFDCSHNNLVSLKYSPFMVSALFDCSNNQILSLEHGPHEIGDDSGSYDCSNNKLVSLHFAPAEVGYFFCDHNNLTTLEGAPIHVASNGNGSMFDCSYNKLTSLKGIPRTFEEDANFSHNHINSFGVNLRMVQLLGRVNFADNPNKNLSKLWTLLSLDKNITEAEAFKMTDNALAAALYKVTKDTSYLPDALKKVFLIKDKK